MANITPSSPVPFSDVYQLETTDLVLGGAGQVANRQAQSLVNRTQYLKDKFENDYAPKVITANATLPISDLTNYSVEGSGISISINDYTKSGFKIRVLVDNDTSVTYTDSSEETVTETFTAGSLTELTWNGTYWEHTNPFTISTTQTLNPKFPMSIAIDTDDVVLTLGDGAYVGYELPVLAKAVCSISYTGEDGATTDELNPSDYITYVWQGTYWIVDASTYDKPVVISTTQSIAPTKKMSIIIDTADVVLTLLSGLYPTFELPILAQANCTVRRLTSSGWVADSLTPSAYNVYVWDGTYWLPRESTAVTGIDDNGQPFAFNIDALTQADGVINITGTDADGNPFDYGLGRLVTHSDAVTPNKVLVSDALGNVSASSCPSNRIGIDAVHQVTLPSDITGQVYYVVTNSMCHLYVTNLNFSGLNGKTISNVVPKAKLTGHNFLYQGNQIWVSGGSKDLNIYKLVDIAINGSVDYPVADDWVES